MICYLSAKYLVAIIEVQYIRILKNLLMEWYKIIIAVAFWIVGLFLRMKFIEYRKYSSYNKTFKEDLNKKNASITDAFPSLLKKTISLLKSLKRTQE